MMYFLPLVIIVAAQLIQPTTPAVARFPHNGTAYWTNGSTLLTSGPTLIWGVENVTALTPDADIVWGTTPSCVFSVHAPGVAHVRIGNLLEPGQRTGPWLYARFTQLVAIAPGLYLLDAGRLLRADAAWQSVTYVASYPDAFALASAPAIDGAQLLILTPALAYNTAHANSSSIAPPVAGTQWVAGTLSPGAFLLDSHNKLWLWHHTTHLLAQPPISMLLAPATPLLPDLWVYYHEEEAFVQLNFTMVTTTTTPYYVIIDSRTTWPYFEISTPDILLCPVGYLLLYVPEWHQQLCLQAPMGGYAIDGAFHACPAGTHNEMPMASDPAVCIPCPPSTIAPVASSGVCSHCPLWAPWQSADGTTCLAACPAYNPPSSTLVGRCARCPPGQTFVATACVPCPPDTVSNADGDCVACPPGQYATPVLCIQPQCHSSMQHKAVYTLATDLPTITALAACRNGTLYVAAGAMLWALPVSTTIPAVALSLSLDEAVLYVVDAPGYLFRVTERHQQVTRTPVYVPGATVLCATLHYVYILDASGIVHRFDEADASTARFMTNVLHITPSSVDDSILALVRFSATQLRVLTLPQQQLLHTLQQTVPWILHVRDDTLLTFQEHALVQMDATASTTVLASGAAYVDNELPLARVVNLTLAVPFKASLYYFLFMVESGNTIRLLYERANCTCPADTYQVAEGVCVPCPPLTYAMPGALGCTACPRGTYRLDQTTCQPCPVAYWWQGLDPCMPMQDSAVVAARLSFYFREICLLTTKDDFVSHLLVTSLSSSSFALSASDYLGRMWTTTPPFFPPPLHSTPQGCIPGLWFACAPPQPDPLMPCTCWYTIPLSFDYFDGHNVQTPSLWSQRHAGERSLFAFRANTRVPNVLHQLPTNSTHIPLDAAAIEGDTGLCYVGWPAQCDCIDPTYYWSLDDAACLPCPSGTAVPHNSLFECLPISDIDNPLCYEGQYFDGQRCRGCPFSTYSDTKMASACRPKTVLTCPPDHYVHLSDATRDNECRLCEPCPALTVPPGASCPGGNATRPPYICMSATAGSIAGAFMTVGMDEEPAYTRCPEPPPLYSEWVSGPLPQFCYFGCRYHISPYQQEYALLFAMQHPLFQQPQRPNAFPITIADDRRAADRVCTACNLSACPPRMWRPLWDSVCGAPCLLRPAACPFLELDGCVPMCPIPPYGYYIDATTCQWACVRGWFRVNSTCMRCEPASCAVGEFYDAEACFSGQAPVCEPCAVHRQHTLSISALTTPGICTYICAENYFPAPECVLCAALTSSSYYCPAGSSAVCAATPCTPCDPLLLPQSALWVPTNDSVCRVRCKSGYHTIDTDTGNVLPFALEEAYDPATIRCDECGLRSLSFFCPSITCPASETLVQIAETNGFRCIPCQTPACPLGTHAPCDITQLHCVLCPPLPDLMFYVAGDCAFACPDNMVVHNNTCVDCNVLYPTFPEAAKPYYDHFVAQWNADPAARWWPPEADPFHFPLRHDTDTKEKRAGICWPSPVFLPQTYSRFGAAVQSDVDTILEVPPHHRRLLSRPCDRDGFYWSTTFGACALCPPQHFCIDGAVEQCPLFTTANAAGSTACECLPWFVPNGTECVLPQRTLPPAALAFQCPSDLIYTLLPTGVPACFPCPPGTRPILGECLDMPPDITNNCSAAWLPFEETCACEPGYQPTTNTTSACEPCAIGTFSPHIGYAPCIPCPANTSTFAEASTHIAQCLSIFYY